MLYGNDSISYYSKSNVSIWMLLAFQAGLLNIGGFMACHRFVSHVTGFATFFGYEISQPDSSHAIGMLVVPLFFLMGAMLSGLLVDTRLRMHKKPKYYLTFGIIFFLILLVFVLGDTGRLGVFGQPLNSAGDYLLLVILCLVCGIQNGSITTVSKSVVRTTHLTGITTDLGIGLVRLMTTTHADEEMKNEKRSVLMRIGIITFFSSGSIAGGFAFHQLQFNGFFIPVLTSGLLFGLMIYFQLLKPKFLQN
ncbi:MAG: DUF1275 domain-containing protein [Rhizobacter sp.]|nr:DUF1275 domain-containing protein [Bacteriovorax sp.]